MNDNNFKLHPWQSDAVTELHKSLEGRCSGGSANRYDALPRSPHLSDLFKEAAITPDMAARLVAHRSNFRTEYADETSSYLTRIAPLLTAQQAAARKRGNPDGWLPMRCNETELPFTDAEVPPSQNNVWDTHVFTPAVELCDRLPLLLIADDWRRATTFDLYTMAIKPRSSRYGVLSIRDVFGVKRWVEFMDDVQHLSFDDVTLPAEPYMRYVSYGSVKSLFKAGIGLDYLRLTLVRYLYPLNEVIAGRTECDK